MLIATVTAAQSIGKRPWLETLQQYFELLETGNYESAGYLWTESVQERSARFGIEYTGIAVRADATSPIIQDIDTYRYKLYPAAKQIETLTDGFVRMEYSTLDRGKLVNKDYFAQQLGDYYWLTQPQDYYARNWPVRETEYFRIHYHETLEKYLHPIVLTELDRFVEMTADSLELSDKDLEMIRQSKIEYFYCDSDQTIKEITGHLTKGMLDLATNDIISANFPHYHELTHLMVNIKLKNLPLYTVPLLREGIAVRYGGRWGKKATALMDLGVYLYQEQLVQLDSMLSYRGFLEGSGADLSYPVAGLFATYLQEKVGSGKFFKMYLEASGTYDDMISWDMFDIQRLILEYTGHKDWLDLQLEFNRYLDERRDKRNVVAPGALKKGKEMIAESGFRIRQDKQWLSFEFSGNGSTPLTGNLLFGFDSEFEGKPSLLLDEQYKGTRESEGYRFGVRFDQFEAGLYDYATNQLVAKYIWGITPSPEYFDSENNIISIRFKKELVSEYLSDNVRCKYLPN